MSIGQIPTRFITAIVLTLLCASAPAFAQTRTPPAQAGSTTVPPGHWTVTPFIGLGFSGDLDSGTGAFGAAGGYVWSDRLGFEGELNILPSSESSGVLEVGTNVWTLTGNVLYHFTADSFMPYGVVGIGFGHGSADISGATTTGTNTTLLQTSSTNFVFDFGGGIEKRFTDRVAVRGDLRYFFGGDLVPDYWRLGGGLTFDLGRR